jgi:hypothetical protein
LPASRMSPSARDEEVKRVEEKSLPATSPPSVAK